MGILTSPLKQFLSEIPSLDLSSNELGSPTCSSDKLTFKHWSNLPQASPKSNLCGQLAKS
jgi:hypothetical protein